jgi:methyltransferase family protein
MRPPLLSRVLGRVATRFRTPSAAQQATFAEIFRTNAWGSAESVSGPGSTVARGLDFQEELISVLGAWNVRSLVDAPCGDFNWMRHVLARRDLAYTGVDIVAELIAANSNVYATATRRFICADMTCDDLPKADMILCRDGLVHLSFADARAAIRNFRRSGSRYLLATTFVNHSRNEDVPTGGWRALNLQTAPFSFPAPLVDERCTQSGGHDKRIGLWKLA